MGRECGTLSDRHCNFTHIIMECVQVRSYALKARTWQTIYTLLHVAIFSIDTKINIY